MRETKPELSVVILCYRAGNFAVTYSNKMQKVLEDKGIDYEMVLVGNYKKGTLAEDQTPAVVQSLAQGNERVVAVVKEKEGMMGWDMRSGLDAATGEIIAVIDGDGQMPPEDIIKVYEKFTAGNFDIGKTYRDTRFDGFFRVVMSRVYNLLLKLLFPKVRVKDTNSKPKMLRSEVLRKLKLSSDDWFIDAEIIIKGTYLGLKIVEVPTRFYPNEERPSFVGLRAIIEFIQNLLRYRIKLFKGKLL